ncbi:MAG: methionyl-tRNA formyltransferase [Actinobacteria bacterium]|nr:methionyl-tRNA formyltransferase [Actinomycetota bacterium]
MATLARPGAHPRRIAYLGTPELAVPTLVAIHEAGFEIPLVVTRPDRRRGRGGALSPSPVKAAALERGLQVTDDLEDLRGPEVDLAVVVAYGRIIPTSLLEMIPMVNLHFSLLPRWRGAAPVERALLAGDTRTGVCLMEVAEGLDTGAVFDVTEVEIAADDTLDSLRTRLVDLGTEMVLRALIDGFAEPQPQIGEPVHAAKIDPSELELDWNASAERLSRVVRLGGAWTIFRGRRLKVWSARVLSRSDLAAGALDGVVVGTADGALELLEVQAEGRGRVPATQWRNGAQPSAGDRLGP